MERPTVSSQSVPGRSVPSRSVSRRALLQTGGALSATALLAGCDALSTRPESDGRERGMSRNGREAPQLRRQVKAGDLPPVESRLPNQPLVVTPLEEIGQYGETWDTAILGPANNYWISYLVRYEPLMRWEPSSNEIIPNVAESVEASPDGREFTISLRRGMRWSDGAPFTADDVMFAFEDVMLNAELTPVPPTVILSRDEPATMTKVDDHTVRIAFARPSGLFLNQLAMYEGYLFVSTPRHYLEQFHKAYNPAVEQDAKDAGFSAWHELYLARATFVENTDLPTLHPWSLTTALGNANRVVAERNPYYWKVDTEGSQLPYIDRVIFEVLTDEEVILLKATNGEFDFHFPWINLLTNKPTIAQNAEAGNYRLFDLTFARMNRCVVAFNLAHADPVKREIFQNKDFRIGLSHALNRQEIIDTAFQRTGEPWQAAPREGSDFYDEEFAKQYTEYDPDLAAERLDAAGYSERNDDGIRLGPDGEPISFTVDVASHSVDLIDAMELVRQQWIEAGIDVRVNTVERSLFYTRKEGNEHDVNVWGGDGGLHDAILDPRWYFPYSDESNFATPWAAWFSSRGTDGAEPPETPRRQMELYWELLEEPDAERRSEIFTEILRIAKEEFYVLGLVLPVGEYGIKSNNFRNAPDTMILDYVYPTPGPDRPEQFAIAE